MILVFSIYPRGGLQYDNHLIPGYLEPFDPCDVSFDFYQIYKTNLRFASYTKSRLEKLFHKPFPNISFTYREIKYLTLEQISEINNILGLCSGDNLQKHIKALKRFLKQKHGP